MDRTEFPAFRTLINTMRQTYSQSPLTDQALLLEFNALGHIAFQDVARAVTLHKADPVRGRTCPTAAHLIAVLHPPMPDEETGRANPGAYRMVDEPKRLALTEGADAEERRKERIHAEFERVRQMVRGATRPMPDAIARPPHSVDKSRATADEPLVRAREDGTLEFRCADGSWR